MRPKGRRLSQRSGCSQLMLESLGRPETNAMAEEKKRLRVSRTVYTFRYRDAAAKRLATSDNSLDTLMSFVASSFFVEATINHIGVTVVPYWESIERKLSPKEKLQIPAHYLKFDIDFGTRPFQPFDELVRLRNALAHGRTKRVDFELLHKGDRTFEMRDTNATHWDFMLSSRHALDFYEDASKVVEILFEKSQMEVPHGVASLDFGDLAFEQDGDWVDGMTHDFFFVLPGDDD